MTSQAQYLVADRHYRKLVLPSCIDAMRQFVDLEQRQRAMAEEADRFRRYVDIFPSNSYSLHTTTYVHSPFNVLD